MNPHMAAALVGAVLGEHYRLDAVVGSGGMGTVFRATHLRLRRVVAVKMMHPGNLSSPEARERFLREARANASVQHPNVPVVFDVGDDAIHGPFMVAEFIEGESLDAVLGRGSLVPDRVLHIAVEVAAALNAVHLKNLVHRDVKPENVLLCGQAGVKLVDFGIARIVPAPGNTVPLEGTTEQAQLTRQGGFIGTPLQSSPEQIRGEAVDATSDVFSFGIVLYRMITGRLPFHTAIALVAETPAAPVGEVDDAIPGIAELVMQCLKKDRSHRFANGGQLLDALERLKLAPVVKAAPISAMERPSPPLVAIGPNVIVPGRVLGTEGPVWDVEISRPFVIGDELEIAKFGETFADLAADDRFVGFQEYGEGREVLAPPKFTRDGDRYRLRLQCRAPYARSDANELSDMKLSALLEVEKGAHLAPERVGRILSMCKGGWGVGSEIGSRVAELNERLGGDRLNDIVALELIRLAAVAYRDNVQKRDYPVLEFIERVWGVEVLQAPLLSPMVRARMRLKLCGVAPIWDGLVDFSLATDHIGPKPDLFEMLSPVPPKVSTASQERYDAERVAVDSFLDAALAARGGRGFWEVLAYPAEYRASRCTPAMLRSALEESQVRLRGWYFPHLGNSVIAFQHGVESQTDSERYVEAFRAYRSGLFAWRRAFWEDLGGAPDAAPALGYPNAIAAIAEQLVFLREYYKRMLGDGFIFLSVRLVGLAGRELVARHPEADIEPGYVAKLNEMEILNDTLKVKRLASDFRHLAQDSATALFRTFGCTEISEREIRHFQDRLLQRQFR
jgi:serine/threonine-protein kinase